MEDFLFGLFSRFLIIVSICFVWLCHPHDLPAFLARNPQTCIFTEANQDLSRVDQLFQDTPSLRINQIDYQADVHLTPDEFHYLTDLHQGASVSVNQLQEAIFYLFQKNKFDAIVLHWTKDQDTVNLFFELSGYWAFGALKLHGIWFGSQRYARHYMMQSGERFDQQKHDHSVQEIKHELHKEGHIHASVTSDFVYNQTTKEVTTHITIKRGARAIIQQKTIVVTSDDSALQEEASIMQEQLIKRFGIRFISNYYNHQNLKQEAQTIKKYLSQKGYLSITLNLEEEYSPEGSVAITWRIGISQKKQFIFFGNHFFSYQQLFDLLMQFGRSVWLVPPTILAQEITRFYKEKGFFHIVVEPKEEPDRYFFIIQEGKRATIHAIMVEGAHYFSNTHLKKRCFNFLSKHHSIDNHLIKKGLDLLRQVYEQAGFLDMKVVNYELVPHTQDSYDLRIVIQEGSRALIKKISIVDYPELSAQGPFVDYAPSDTGAPVDLALVQQQRAWLTNHFHQLGYLQAALHPEFAKLEDDTYELKWHITPGQIVQFGKLVVQGSHMIPFKTMSREFGGKKGMLWNQDLLKQSFVRLKSYEVFDELQLVGGPERYAPHERPILIKIHNDDPYELRLRGGMELEHVKNYKTIMGLSYRGGGSFFIKNPFKAFDCIRFDVDVAKFHQEITARYERPWLGQIPLKMTSQLYSINYDQPGFLHSNKNIYSIAQSGFLIGLAYKNELIDAELNSGIECLKTKPVQEQLTLKRIESIARAINFEADFFNLWVPYFLTEQTVILNYLDNALNPRLGSFTLFSLKGMVPLKQHQMKALFVRLLVEQSFFVPLLPWVVAAVRIRAGHIFYQQFKAIMPSERFYLGGSRSLRSYTTDLVPPVGFFIDDQGNTQVVPQGGKSMANVMLELRITVPTLPQVGIVLFHDAGILSERMMVDCFHQPWHMGTGAGLRYLTPIGPLRFDIGFKWGQSAVYDRSYAWFLTFGQAF